MMGPRVGSEKGFTLLELIVSFAMIGIIVIIVTGAMRLGLRSVDSGEKRIDHLERFMNSTNIINAQVQSQMPLTFDEQGEKRSYFEGNSDSMQFATPCSIWGARKGYVIVRYRVEKGENGKHTLVASENIIGTENVMETKLYSDVDAVSFEYFVKDPTAEKGEWQEIWADSLNLPEKVRMHVAYNKKNFSLLIPVRAAGSSSQQVHTFDQLK